jgi:hypothetical protein
MPESHDPWTERMKALVPAERAEDVGALVHEMYNAAQDELDAQRAQAEFEREE